MQETGRRSVACGECVCEARTHIAFGLPQGHAHCHRHAHRRRNTQLEGALLPVVRRLVPASAGAGSCPPRFPDLAWASMQAQMEEIHKQRPELAPYQEPQPETSAGAGEDSK